jgi:ankyrin repeat protein
MIKFMLELGAYVNVADFNGLTVVHYCALIGHWQHLELLISLLSHNWISVSGESIQSCAQYYFRDCIPSDVNKLLNIG